MAASSHFVKKRRKLSIDLKWREMWSKVIFGHPKWPPAAILWKKSWVLIWNGDKCEKKSCVFIWNGEKCDQKWFLVIQNGHWQSFCGGKKVAYWSEMARNAIFGHPKWPPAAILWKKIKLPYWYEMARNAIERDFWSSKMAASSHFVKKKFILMLNEEKCDFRSSKMAGSHFVKKSCLLISNDEICDRKWFSVIQNGRRLPFCENFRSSKMATCSHFVGKKSCVFIWNGEKCDQKRFSVIQNGRQQPFCEKNKLVYWSEMVRNAIERDFRSSKMAACSHFVKKVVLLMLNGEKCDWKWFSVF